MTFNAKELSKVGFFVKTLFNTMCFFSKKLFP
jgi:hypothetical protein